MHKRKLKNIAICAAIVIAAASCISRNAGDFTSEEKALIAEALVSDGALFPEGTMRVLTVCDSADLAVLRSPSTDFSAEALMSDEYAALCSLMVATVTHPSQDGVGIAGPQVGLNRRVVAVQRFDKEPVAGGGEPVADGTSVPDAGDGGTEEGEADYPFEVYPNVRIVWASDSLAYGPEGCLSVPGRRGNVLRSQEIVIEYALVGSRDGGSECSEKGYGSGSGLRSGKGECSGKDGCARTGECSGKGQDGITMVRDTVRGFTAVIFQHEIDHLDGVLYIDRL